MKRFKVFSIILISSFIFSGCTAVTSFFSKNNQAGLQVITNDIPSSVFLDGQYLEKTPYIGKELKPGTFNIKIQPDDPTLVPYETSVTLRKGLLTVITWKPGTRPELSGGVVYELEKLSSKKQVELSVVSIPDGAIVSIDQGPKEFTPFINPSITPGSHDIEISLPSYETQQHTINIVEGHRLNVSVKLAKNPNPQDEVAPTQETTNETPTQEATPAATQTTQTIPTNSSTSSASTVKPAGGATVTIESTNFFQDGKEVLRVRDAAGATGKELGFAEVGASFAYQGESKDGWHKINFNGATGWVSGTYSKLVE